MSTTAGITSQEYVAINIPAIMALVLGWPSVVAMLHVSGSCWSSPLAAIVTAFAPIAVRASNGTQTGRGFAIGGIVLAAC